jgi:hypothetical protein
MCQKSALQCQLTCLYVLYTVNPSPLPLAAIHIVMKLRKFSLHTKCWVINYCIQLQKRHSVRSLVSTLVHLSLRKMTYSVHILDKRKCTEAEFMNEVRCRIFTNAGPREQTSRKEEKGRGSQLRHKNYLEAFSR